MKVIQFDKWSNPTPYTVIELTLVELRANFVSFYEEDSHRWVLFSNYERYRNGLRRVLGVDFRQWIGGSFISLKPDPADVDVANLIQYSDEVDERIDELMPFFLLGGSDESYEVDGHLIPVYDQMDPRYANTVERLAYFQHWFGHDREDRPKGIVEIAVTL